MAVDVEATAPAGPSSRGKEPPGRDKPGGQALPEPPARYDAQTFYPHPHEGDGPPPRLSWPARLAVGSTAAGFASVFLAQAAPLYQVVLGAPVFEELLKAGLGMLLALGVAARGPWRWAARAAATVALAATAGAAAFAAAGTVAGVAAGPASALAAGCAFLAATVAAATWGPSRTRRTSSCTPQRLGVEGGDAEAAGAPRVPLALAALCGLAVGFGFGVLEHVLTYASEPRPLAWLRVTFHAASGGLSLACWSAAVRAGEDARRLAVVATAPATVLHYLNNAGAVVLLLLAPLAPGAGAAATGLSAAVVAATVLAAGAACASLTLARRMLAPAARLLPAGAGRAARAPPRSG